MEKSTVLLSLAAIVLTGCAQFAAQSQREALEREAADVQQRCESLISDPALNPIRDKVAFYYTGEQQTFVMRTNTNYATTEEKPIIALWAQKRDQCEEMQRPILAKAPVQMGAVIKATKQVVDSMIAELYLGNITYGEFANKRAKTFA